LTVALSAGLSLALLAGCAAPMATLPPTQPADGAAPAGPGLAPAIPAVAPTPAPATLRDVWTLEGQATRAGVAVANAPITVYDALTDAPAGSTPDGLLVVNGELKTDAEGRYRVTVANLKPGRAARLFVDGGAWSLSTVARPGEPAAAPTYRVQTNFVVYVDPKTGQTSMIVAAGVVKAPLDERGTAADLLTRGATKATLIYPTQQITLDGRQELQDLKSKVGQLNPADLLAAGASTKVLEAILKNKAEIDRENQELMERQRLEMDSRVKLDPTVKQGLKKNEDLDKIQQSLDKLIGNLAQEAIAQKKLEQKDLDRLISEVNQKLADPTRPVDLSKLEQLGKGTGLDPDFEQKKQAELERLRAEKRDREAAELALMLETQRRLAELLKNLEAEQRRLEDANKAALEEAKKRAEAELKAQLDRAMQEALAKQQALVRQEQEALKKADELARKAAAEQLLQQVTAAALEALAQAAQANGNAPLSPEAQKTLAAGIPMPGVAGGVGLLSASPSGLTFQGARGRLVNLSQPGAASGALQQQLGQAISPPRSSGRRDTPVVSLLKPGAAGHDSDEVDDGYRFNWWVGEALAGVPFVATFNGGAETPVLLELTATVSRPRLTLTEWIPAPTIEDPHGESPVVRMRLYFDLTGAPVGEPYTEVTQEASFLKRVALADIEMGDIYHVDPELATSAPTRWTSFPGAESAGTHIAFLDAWGHQNEIVLDEAGVLLAGRIWYREAPSFESEPPSSEDVPFQRIDFWRAPITN
jgi:hypothetical protein